MRALVCCMVLALAAGGCTVDRGEVIREPEPLPPDDATTVSVYQLRDGANPFRKESYAPSKREVRLHADRTRHLLRLALEELVKGTTRSERRAGFRSVFSRALTEGLVRNVKLTGEGSATVDLVDFRRVLPLVGGTEGGTTFLLQLHRTVFQFPDVERVEYRMDGSCRAFWNVLQGRCQVVTRRDYERVP